MLLALFAALALQDVMLPTIDGEDTVRLSELRDKPLLLLQFASW